ncbi:hypothetical protein [Halorussus lipolyticus]|nr:hypothetical protein [Halorussus sp. DT80]
MSQDVTTSLESQYEQSHDETDETVAGCDTLYDPVCSYSSE